MTNPDPIIQIQADALVALVNAVQARREAEDAVSALVVRSVRQGCTWRQVGACLGTSGQAAWERYRPAYANRFDDVSSVSRDVLGKPST